MNRSLLGCVLVCWFPLPAAAFVTLALMATGYYSPARHDYAELAVVNRFVIMCLGEVVVGMVVSGLVIRKMYLFPGTSVCRFVVSGLAAQLSIAGLCGVVGYFS